MNIILFRKSLIQSQRIQWFWYSYYLDWISLDTQKIP